MAGRRRWLLAKGLTPPCEVICTHRFDSRLARAVSGSIAIAIGAIFASVDESADDREHVPPSAVRVAAAGVW